MKKASLITPYFNISKDVLARFIGERPRKLSAWSAPLSSLGLPDCDVMYFDMGLNVFTDIEDDPAASIITIGGTCRNFPITCEQLVIVQATLE
jgi:hypothetical protein